MSERVVFDEVSKFYGEVLGVNRVSLEIEPGITALVGPNGSGKTTLMNLMTGLLRPTEGGIEVLGRSPRDSRAVFGLLGYCTQYDAFPRALTGERFLRSYLRLYGLDEEAARRRAREVLDHVGLAEAADRRIAGYSKGMRQRLKLAQATAHEPRVVLLDEPLNGLDPMARAEFMALFRELAGEGRLVIISSHILHEVDLVADEVVLVRQGYVVAEGDIPEVREEMVEHPLRIAVRCARPASLASRLFAHDHVVEVQIHDDGGGLMVTTERPASFYRLMNSLVVDGEVAVETLAPADDDALAVYEYAIGEEGA